MLLCEEELCVLVKFLFLVVTLTSACRDSVILTCSHLQDQAHVPQLEPAITTHLYGWPLMIKLIFGCISASKMQARGFFSIVKRSPYEVLGTIAAA